LGLVDQRACRKIDRVCLDFYRVDDDMVAVSIRGEKQEIISTVLDLKFLFDVIYLYREIFTDDICFVDVVRLFEYRDTLHFFDLEDSAWEFVMECF
jgi:hypothetical protein